MKEVTTIQECRVCSGRTLIPVFSLGDQYVATSFLKSPEEASKHKRYPLDLVICGDDKNSGCGFVQLKHTVARDMLFETYWYRSGINQTMRNALEDVVKQIPLFTDLKDGDVVCDIGSNDGTLLSFYPKTLKRIGIDPAGNMAEFSRKYADEIVSDYFSSSAFFSTGNKKAKAVTSIAMFYSVVDPVSFAKSVYEILDDDGVWILQMSSLPLMIANNCYDNIVHEHVGYYTVDVMRQLLEKIGLYIVDGETNDINAGSVRLYIKKKPMKAIKELDKILQDEITTNYRSLKVYQDFSNSVQEQTQKFKNFLKDCDPDSTCFYGASTKGNVILQYLGITENDAFGIAERNPLKFGYFTLGSGLKIIPEDEMRKRKPKNIVVLPYHFKKEIIHRESEMLKSGSRLIFPLPEFEAYSQ